ncbi:NAD-dependent isocitrate dehydrogenase [Pestalotiopsis sp. IQ-011]
MPPINHAALSAGVIAVGLVVAVGVAIYESPELRRIAEDLRQRIAVALHSLGDSISPQERENLYNRPEDAEGFLLSRGIDVRAGGEQGVDADEETRRRQREELLYWNAIADSKRDQEKKGQEKMAEVEPRRTASRGSSFDDFLKKDATNEKGAFIFNSGADVQGAEAEGLRRRGDGARGLNYSVLTNPFADEHGIDEHVALENSLMEPEKDELDDIYSVSQGHQDDRDRETSATLSSPPEHIPSDLIDVETPIRQPMAPPAPASVSELGSEEYMTAGQDDRHDAYSSIQAWAQASHSGFYSPLPVSPAGPLSEPELISEGQLTPTDSASLAGSGEDIGEEIHSVSGRHDDVMSDDEGMLTPASWTEVGSVISESDGGAHPAHL